MLSEQHRIVISMLLEELRSTKLYAEVLEVFEGIGRSGEPPIRVECAAEGKFESVLYYYCIYNIKPICLVLLLYIYKISNRFALYYFLSVKYQRRCVVIVVLGCLILYRIQ